MPNFRELIELGVGFGDSAVRALSAPRGVLGKNSDCKSQMLPDDGGMLTKNELLDLQFIDARARLLDLAAFLDRLERHEGEEDSRMKYFRKAIPILMEETPGRARRVLEAFSDHSTEIPLKAEFQGAKGAPIS